MGKMQREKGKRGERELASKLREYGFNARRGQQFCGANGDADVVGLDDIHIECKRTERLNLYEALAQAKADKKDGERPIICHRKNNCEWVVIQPLEDWIDLFREWQNSMHFKRLPQPAKIKSVTEKEKADLQRVLESEKVKDYCKNALGCEKVGKIEKTDNFYSVELIYKDGRKNKIIISKESIQ